MAGWLDNFLAFQAVWYPRAKLSLSLDYVFPSLDLAASSDYPPLSAHSLCVFSIISRPSASRKWVFLPLASRRWSLWKSSDVCLATGIPSELLSDVTCDVRADSTEAGRRRLTDEASQKRVKATDICQCASESEEAAQGICGMKCETFCACIVPSQLDAGCWMSICLAEVKLPAVWSLCVSSRPMQRISPWDNPDHLFLCVYIAVLHNYPPWQHLNTVWESFSPPVIWFTVMC